MTVQRKSNQIDSVVYKLDEGDVKEAMMAWLKTTKVWVEKPSGCSKEEITCEPGMTDAYTIEATVVKKFIYEVVAEKT